MKKLFIFLVLLSTSEAAADAVHERVESGPAQSTKQRPVEPMRVSTEKSFADPHEARLYLPFMPGFSMHEENFFAWRVGQRFLNGKPRDGSGYTRAKFQISVRYELFNTLGWRSIRCNTWPGPKLPPECAAYMDDWSLSIAFAYTQKSFWDIFSSARSAPFVESNYRPELMIVLRPSDYSRGRELFLGFMHESNGLGYTPQDRSDFPGQTSVLKGRSRSWNNLFIGARWSHPLPWSFWSVSYGGRAWVRIAEAQTAGMVRDLGITSRFGAEISGSLKRTVFYEYSDGRISNLSRIEFGLRARARSATLTAHWTDPFGTLKGWLRPSLYTQFFVGKGESLGTAQRTNLAGYLGLGLL